MLIEGKLPDIYRPSCKYIESYYKKNHNNNETSKHYWINNVQDVNVKDHLDKLRFATVIKHEIQKAYPSYVIENVPETDEVYISVDPSKRRNSDIALSDCHYDAPFKYIPQGGNIFIRVILAITENKTTYTVIEDKVSMLSTLEFNGMDYNKDYHCVKGYIPEGEIRIILKLHFICIHPNSSQWSRYFCREINNRWTHLSREAMRRTVSPKTVNDKILNYIILSVRYIYIHINIIILIFIIIIVLLKIFSKTKFSNQ